MSGETTSTFASRLAQAIEAAGITQAELGRSGTEELRKRHGCRGRAPITAMRVWKLLDEGRGARPEMDNEVHALAKVLKCRVEWLALGKGRMKGRG